jgi:hypothetical protein
MQRGQAVGVHGDDVDALRSHGALELGCGAGRDLPPMVDEHDPVGQGVRLVEVLRREQQRHAVAHQVAHRAPDDLTAPRVQPRRRLVEHEQRGPMNEARGEIHPAALASGDLADRPAGEVAAVEALDELVGDAPRGRTVVPAQRGDEAQVLAPRQVGVQRGELPGQGDAPADGVAVGHDVVAVHGCGAGGRRDERGDHADRRGLAGAVRAEQRDDGSPGHAEVQAVDGDDCAVALRQPLGLDGGSDGCGGHAPNVQSP